MPTRSKTSQPARRLTYLGAPEAGAVSALALGGDPGRTLFVGSPVGVYRARAADNQAFSAWERLPMAPIGILALAASPDFARDQTILAGTGAGIYVSRDGGESWTLAPMPMSGSSVSAFAFSPTFAADGFMLAGTLEDGIVVSEDRGETWYSRSFGLLDAAIFSVAFSPDFAADGTVYAGTETAVYFSYNQGLAWKDLHFPEDVAPVLSLAVVAAAGGPTLFAGTEAHGLHRSIDHGRTWEKAALPADCINVLDTPGPGAALLAATELGVFRSMDQGAAWTLWLDQPNLISLAASGSLTVAGSVEQGFWAAEAAGEWQPVPGLTTRSFVGLVLSPAFPIDRVAFLYGPQERIWHTADGGRTWAALHPDLPMLDFRALAVAPDFAASQGLAAAANAGVLVSATAGQSWQRTLKEPAGLVAYSPNGKILAAAVQGGILASHDMGQTWRRLPGPWEHGGQVAALAVSNDDHFYVAHLEGIGATLAIWQGQPHEMAQTLSETVGGNPIVSFFVPAEPTADRPWFAAYGSRVWRLSSRRPKPSAEARVFDADASRENIVALTGAQGPDGLVLFACTGRRVYKSTDGEDWSLAYDFGPQRAVSIALPAGAQTDGNAYFLLLGGTVCRAAIV